MLAFIPASHDAAVQLIPALAGSLYAAPTSLSQFDPSDAPYKATGANFSWTTSQGLDNTFDGPGLVETWAQAFFSTVPERNHSGYILETYEKRF